MPRKDATLTIEQIDKFLEMTAHESDETVRAVRRFLTNEKKRRVSAGNRGGKPQKYEGNARERHLQAMREWRSRKKENLK